MTPVEFQFNYPDGKPIAGMEFVIKLPKSGFIHAVDGIIMPADLKFVTDAMGYALVELAPSSSVYTVRMTTPDQAEDYDSCRKGVTYKFYVPDSAEPVRAQDLFLAPPPNSEPWDETAIRELTEAKVIAVQSAETAVAASVAAEASADRAEAASAGIDEDAERAERARDASEAFAIDALAARTETDADRIAAQQAALDAGNAAQTRVNNFKDELVGKNGTDALGFIQTGLSAAIRRLTDKLRDHVNIKDYGVVADGIVDDTAKMQAIINEFGGKKRIEGGGKLRLTNTLTYHTSGNVPGLSLDLDPGTEFIGDFEADTVAFPDGKPILSLNGSGVLSQFQKNGLIKNIKFSMSISGLNVCGIQTVGAWGYQVDRCNLRDLGMHGIYIPNRTDLHANPDMWASVSWRIVDTDIVGCFDGVHSQAGQGSSSWEFNNCYVVNNRRNGYLVDGSGHRFIKGSCAYNGKGGSGSGIKYERHLGVTPSNAYVEQVEIDSNFDAGFEADYIGFVHLDKNRFISKNEIHNADSQLSHIKIKNSVSSGLMRGNLHRIDDLAGSTVTLYDFGAASPNIAGVRVEAYRVQNDTGESVVEASPGALAAVYGNTVVKAGAAGAKNSDYSKFVYKGEAAVGGVIPATLTTINFKNTQLATGWTGQHNSTTGVITVPYTGGYIIQGDITVSALANGARFQIHILRNGVAIKESYFDAPAATARHTLAFFAAGAFTIGDTIEIRASCGAGASNLMERTNCLLVMAI